MLLALNKADLGSALTHLARLRAAKPHEAAVAVSAASERWLCQQRRAGRLEYADGAGTIVLAPGCDERTAREAARMQASVLDRYGTTGVLAALSSAVALKCPAVVFPVADLESFAALPAKACGASGGMLGSGTEAKARAAQGANTSIMRDCLLMRPGSTVLDVMQVLKQGPPACPCAVLRCCCCCSLLPRHAAREILVVLLCVSRCSSARLSSCWTASLCVQSAAQRLHQPPRTAA